MFPGLISPPAPVILKSATVLTPAQIKGLAGTPIVLISAVPGAVIWPIACCYVLNFVTTAYAGASALYLNVQWGSSGSASTQLSTSNSPILSSTSSAIDSDFLVTMSGQVIPGNPDPWALTDCLGAAVEIQTYNNVAPTAGDSPLTVILYYTIINPAGA